MRVHSSPSASHRRSLRISHLKSYQIDGCTLRTGAVNFSASGLKRQDNDLIIIESAEDGYRDSVAWRGPVRKGTAG
jgi:hypothetical protein